MSYNARSLNDSVTLKLQCEQHKECDYVRLTISRSERTLVEYKRKIINNFSINYDECISVILEETHRKVNLNNFKLTGAIKDWNE